MYNNSTSYANQVKAVSAEKNKTVDKSSKDSETEKMERLRRNVEEALEEYRKERNKRAFEESERVYNLYFAEIAKITREEEKNAISSEVITPF